MISKQDAPTRHHLPVLSGSVDGYALPTTAEAVSSCREAVRNQAEEAIEAFAHQLGITRILPGLSKTLHSTKVPRILSAALSIFCNLYEELAEDEAPPDAAHLR